MTNEEAIIQDFKQWMNEGDGRFFFSNVYAETICDALEKQIPKKPFVDYNGVIHKDKCPTCGVSLFPYDHHCNCGQAIDWSGEK